MTQVLLSIEPPLLALTLAAWTWVAVRAGSLATPGAPRELQRRCGRLLLGVSVGAGSLLSWVVLLAALAGSGSGSGQDLLSKGDHPLGQDLRLGPEAVVLGLPVTVLPVLAALAGLSITVPRLLAIRRAALTLNGIGTMSPALRQQAAHPLIIWPLQLTALGVMAAGLIPLVAVVPNGATLAPAVLMVAGLAALVGWHRLARRHRHLGGDVVVPWRRSRRPVWASTMEGHLLNSSR